MKFSNYMDMHTHSDHSFDGNHSCMLLCESAQEKGLSGIAITDHCEIDAKKYDFRTFCTNQFVDTYKTKRFFEGQLLVLQGLELGQAIYNKELAENILSTYRYDFVLGSIHNLENMEDFYFLDYSNYDIYELLDRYFDALIELCIWNNFDSLAHLTYPLRYIIGNAKLSVDLRRFADKIETILKLLVDNHKALEINTSGLFLEMNETLPGKDTIKLFKQLGGEYITIGSDSHFFNKIGLGIEQGMEIAKECGFDYFTIYEKREPVLLPIK